MTNGNSSGILDRVTPDQEKAIKHTNSHARLLAGPGTGKTHVLTRKVLWLILQEKVKPEEILALTFTRLAAAQLRNDLKKALDPHGLLVPGVSTLHSFALRHILYNSGVVKELPSPVRVADDWEERNIIQEDIKKLLQVNRIEEVQKLIHRLSADWEQLRVEEAGWEENFPNAKFLGALNDHKTVYGETMRAELVYKLKRCLEQAANFKLDQEYKYVLVDEYQDLNACDLAVVRSLAERGAKLFVVGDDDQSIYGFRYANPVGIRQFPEVYEKAERLDLETCFRCDKEILRQAEFVADQDIQRLPKKTKPQDGADEGEVLLIQFPDNDKEALGVATKIKSLIDGGISENKIVILSRSNVILGPIKKALLDKGIKVSETLEDELESSNEFRMTLSTLRLLTNSSDSLAARCLIELEKNKLGDKSIDALWNLASTKGIRFLEALSLAKNNPSIILSYGVKIKSFADALELRLSKLNKIEDISEQIKATVAEFTTDPNLSSQIEGYFLKIKSEKTTDSLDEVVKSIGASSDKIEQGTASDAVSILTMHQAKGLTFDVCFIVGAEDEFLPGRNEGEFIGDERRLLYVSMTRAKHKLYITYCAKRIGKQRFYGRVIGGQEKRTLTRFLKDAKIRTPKLKS